MKIMITPTQKKIIDLCAVLCLVAVFVFSFFYMRSWRQKAFGQESAQETAAAESNGTWCTIKSNSLDGIPVYDEAGGSVQTGTIPEGKCCHVTENVSHAGKRWMHIEYAGFSGWVPKSRLRFIAKDFLGIQKGSEIYINASTEKGIKAYDRPNIQGEVVADGILYGEEFTVLAVKDGWGKVELKDETGWINLYYAGCYLPSEQVCWKVQTLSRAQAINLRESPGEGAKSLGKVPEKTKLVIETYENGWGKTSYEGQSGWVMLSYLAPRRR